MRHKAPILKMMQYPIHVIALEGLQIALNLDGIRDIIPLIIGERPGGDLIHQYIPM